MWSNPTRFLQLMQPRLVALTVTSPCKCRVVSFISWLSSPLAFAVGSEWHLNTNQQIQYEDTD